MELEAESDASVVVDAELVHGEHGVTVDEPEVVQDGSDDAQNGAEVGDAAAEQVLADGETVVEIGDGT
ncbi:hypothetical protein V5O48_007818, partial [Marasmius crinis-equi]